MTNKDTSYIDTSGNIIVPFNADPKYHSWSGGQDLSKTMQEINVPEEVWMQYIKKLYPGNAA